MKEEKNEAQGLPERVEVGELFQSLHDNVLLLRDTIEKEERTVGGIIIPKSAKKKPPNTAKVMAVGPDVKTINVGDTVIVGAWSGTKIELQDETYEVVEDSQILGIFKG